MKAGPLPSVATLKSVFRYDKKTGRLFWKKRKDFPANRNSALAYTVAGNKTGRYAHVGLNNKHYSIHRIVFKMLNGWEPVIVDHKNSKGKENHAANLRAASFNSSNWNRVRKHGKVLPKWVWLSNDHAKRRKKYKATVAANGVIYQVGRFRTPEEAYKAAENVARRLHGEYFRPDDKWLMTTELAANGVL